MHRNSSYFLGKLIREDQFVNIELEFVLKYANLCKLMLNDELNGANHLIV